MAKGSKKYAGHEYSFASPAKSGLGKELGAQKSAAASSRRDSRTYPHKMADGGTIQSGISQAASQGGVPHTTVNTMGSVSSGLASAFGKKAHGGKIEAKSEDQKAKHKGNNKKDDKIPILASQDEVLLPRSVTKSKDAPKKAANFMKKEMKK